MFLALPSNVCRDLSDLQPQRTASAGQSGEEVRDKTVKCRIYRYPLIGEGIYSMNGGAPDGEALVETIVVMQYFSELPDPRQSDKVMYPLPEVLLLCRNCQNFYG
jgi:hypothetical protein